MSEGTFSLGRLVPAAFAMGIVILASNILVEYPVQAMIGSFNVADWVTYGALSYPVAFLVTDTTNRVFGAAAARKVVIFGFVLGVILSLILADMRIAAASGTAFLVAQLLDVFVFDKLRRQTWWKAPFLSSLAGSALDTVLFFSIAFAGTGLPWQSWAFGDFVIKLILAGLLLPVFRALMALIPSTPQNGAAAA
ncbi:queuosine precursor transporter [Rhodospirillaceae bacterium KN72]|uniref:Probable queuosine precursor transporter n=1 Tax=Pacificispira spongiicola TaxID=2729598 RepID=A0A7Y0DXR7_9PROT|nr:queuosine precursor transporter [Pacificispira spongiicola]NMM43564.1 queuosine precursor transporter [Pacificispira spongiicola]